MDQLDIVIPARNAAREIEATLAAALAQRLPPDVRRTIIVADDGSDDDTASLIAARFGAAVRVVSLGASGGCRAAARNVGAGAGGGDWIVFLDADCRLLPGALQAHVDSLRAGAELSIGRVTTAGEGFWARYQRAVAQRRERGLHQGDIAQGTTACFAIARSVFIGLGGFDTRYRGYGFEDRDLFLRAQRAGRKFVFTPDAVVVHEDDLTLAQVCAKMYAAGKTTAPLFRASHPAAYRASVFSRADATQGGVLRRCAGALAQPLSRRAPAWTEPLLGQRWIPFSWRSAVARGVCGLAYLAGTWAGRERASRR